MSSDQLIRYITGTLWSFIEETQGEGGSGSLQDASGPTELQLLKLFEYARQITNDDFLGLADSPCPRGSFLFRGEIAVRCSTLREALLLAFQYTGFICPSARFSLTPADDEAIIEIDIAGVRSEIANVQRTWMLMTTISLAQWLIGSKIDLNWVELPVPMRLNFGEYSQVFGGRCSFNFEAARTGFPEQFLQRRIIRSPQDYGSHMRSPMGNVVEPKTLSRSWKEQVKRRLRVNLGDDRPFSTIEKLAEEYGICGQTLRRRLKEEKSSYRLLKAEVRREAALDALSAEDVSLSEASMRAGFAEANGLSRALRSSTGRSPSQLRNQLRDWQASKAKY